MDTKRLLLKVLPYCASILSGFLFLYIGLVISQDFRGLFVNIAAAFFAIPLIYLFYQQARNLSQKRLNREMFNFAKMQIGADILSIIKQLQKIIYPLKENEHTLPVIDKFLSLDIDEIKRTISDNEYVGFQVFKKWEIVEEHLHSVVENPYMLNILENEQIISIIHLIQNLRNLENIQKFSGLYVSTGKKSKSFAVISGREINEENTQFPERYLLLRKLGDEFIVADFGDFESYNRDKLQQIFVVNEKLRDFYCNAIYNLIKSINRWLDLSGTEFKFGARTEV